MRYLLLAGRNHYKHGGATAANEYIREQIEEGFSHARIEWKPTVAIWRDHEGRLMFGVDAETKEEAIGMLETARRDLLEIGHE